MRYGDHNYSLLVRPAQTRDGSPQWRPRLSVCGERSATDYGLVPVLDYPSALPDPKDFKEIIGRLHSRKRFALYHQKRSRVFEDGWNQDGFGLCWAYGVTACLMSCRAAERKAPVRLAPFSLAWLVNWRNAGYYCDATIRGTRERGIASAAFVPEYDLNPRNFKVGWEDDALNYRLESWWDTRRTSDMEMMRQVLAILMTGRSCYVAFNWWSHALELVGLLWDESEYMNLVVQCRNSHGENAPIELTGRRMIPDECYGGASGSFRRAA